MKYREPLYRPPSEAFSLLVQATYGCPWNKCSFCGMYKGTRYRVRSVEEVKQDLAEAHYEMGRHVRTLFLPDANTIAMPTDRLVEICDYAYKIFPYLERITVYGSAMFVLKKKPGDLARLRRAGLKRIHMGMESGHAPTLKLMNKGVEPEQIIRAGRMVVEAGIELSEYYLVGLGGVSSWEEHAIESAKVLSAIRPRFIRLRTLYPVPNSPLYQEVCEGRFELVGPKRALMEIRLFLEHLDTESEILSDHVSNYVDVNGWFPRDKKSMLSVVDEALELGCEELEPRNVNPGL